jgi:hypothetical protein
MKEKINGPKPQETDNLTLKELNELSRNSADEYILSGADGEEDNRKKIEQIR